MAVVRRVVSVGRIAAFVVGVLVLVALYGLALWRAPELLVNQDLLGDSSVTPTSRLTAEHNARLIVISLGGALVVIVGLLYTARNYRLAHRGQVTERFTKALERLGSDEMYVRIGGVHALEHVMRDSPEHHGDVVEVLVAFIRDRAPRRVKEPVDETRWIHPPIGPATPELPSEPDADVQAALTTLGDRPKRVRRERGGVDFHKLHIQGAVLWGAQLQRAKLEDAQLQDAVLGSAQLQGAFLRGAQLRVADLTGAQLWIADLSGAQLQGADLGSAQLRSAELVGAQLQGAFLRGAQLQGADLRGAQLQGADLWEAQLQGADLRGAQLQGAFLARAVVTADQLSSAQIDENTMLPDGLTEHQDD